MANVKGAPQPAPTKEKKVAPIVEAIPSFVDESGNLKKLRGRDFPKTKEGKTAFCDYQIAKWTRKRDRVAISADPKAKKLKKIEKLKSLLAKLEEDMAKEGAATV